MKSIKVKPVCDIETEYGRAKLIVGICPNRCQWQVGDNSDVALDTRSISGRIVHDAVKGISNVWLTNLTNWTLDPKRLRRKDIADGIAELETLCRLKNPDTIVCLSDFVFAKAFNVHVSATMHSIQHPSYVNRFHHKEVPEYIKLIRRLVTC